MPLQILTLKLAGVTAGDYLTWCRDPDPPALDFALRSISIDADPFGDTITATLDWNHHVPAAPAAAGAAGLPLAPEVQLQPSAISEPEASPGGADDRPLTTEPRRGAGLLATWLPALGYGFG